MTDAMETATSLLALAALVGAAAIVVARLVARWSPAVAAVGARVVGWRRPITFAVAAVATAGSLYFSEIADFIPCRLCWFQRVAMYPIAVIGLVALLRRDDGSRWYAVPLAAIGAAISGYHYLIERGVLDDSESCSAFGPPCSVKWFEEFGFVTLAFMALAGFVAIIVVNTVSFDPARSREVS